MKAYRPPDRFPAADDIPRTAETSPLIIEDATDAAETENKSSPELTQRQRQILELLSVGKVNKEIAKELGIGVGTVKQHVVALFKRLNVSNRTMAVSRGFELLGERPQPEAGTSAPADGILERRPCVVLSLALPEQADDTAVRRLHGALAALAFDKDAVFLARRGNAGDLIFGLHQVSDRDLMKAVHTAQRMFEDLQSFAPDLADGMRGGLTVGMVVASMLRNGGWSGEAIASTSIAFARELQEQAQPGWIAVGTPVLDLMKAFGIRGDAALFANEAQARAVSFSALAGFDWSGDRITYPLVGRAAEIKTFRRILQRAGAGKGQLVFLEGETGMGKSRLCREVLALCRTGQGTAVFYRVLPDAGNCLRDQENGNVTDAPGVFQGLAAVIHGEPSLLIVDDCHFLVQESRRSMIAAAREAVQAGWIVVFSGRHMPEIDKDDAETIRLKRQSVREIESLVRHVLKVEENEKRVMAHVHRIVKDASGVPLFAVELARHRQEDTIAMSLLVTVAARLDGLHLDRKLLRTVARRNPSPTTAEIAGLLSENPDAIAQATKRAIVTGVLQADPQGHLTFGHPLLRKIIDYLSLE